MKLTSHRGSLQFDKPLSGNELCCLRNNSPKNSALAEVERVRLVVDVAKETAFVPPVG